MGINISVFCPNRFSNIESSWSRKIYYNVITFISFCNRKCVFILNYKLVKLDYVCIVTDSWGFAFNYKRLGHGNLRESVGFTKEREESVNFVQDHYTARCANYSRFEIGFDMKSSFNLFQYKFWQRYWCNKIILPLFSL